MACNYIYMKIKEENSNEREQICGNADREES